MAAALASVPLQPLPAPQSLLVNGIRHDGRSLEEFRKDFALDVGMISRATGSAYVEFGLTKVVAAIYGPRPNKSRLGFSDTGCLNVEASFTPAAAPARMRQALRAAEKDLSSCVAGALSPALHLASLPKAVVDLQLLVLEADGSVEAAAITAGSLAAAHAGLAMSDLVPAVCVAQVQGQLVMDPDRLEQQRQEGGLLVAYMPNKNEVTQAVCVGAWSNSSSKEALELALGGATMLRDVMRGALDPGS